MNGLVLSGGQSSRMGTDKALIDYHGIPQYAYVYDLLLRFLYLETGVIIGP